MKEYISRPGAIGALLDEYEKAIAELKLCIEDVSDSELIAIADPNTSNPDCSSIQTVLTHVVSSVYSYAVYIRNLKGRADLRPEKQIHSSVEGYLKGLDDAFGFTVHSFDGIEDMELEEFADAKKIHTRWGQVYDIEQITEHAIVHILRHRRQLEKFKMLLQR